MPVGAVHVDLGEHRERDAVVHRAELADLLGGPWLLAAEEIGEFCSVNYGVTFPMFAKIDVNGPDRHPLYVELTQTADAEGKAGDIQWNFEKFLVGRDGKILARFRPMTEPEAPEVVEAIEAALPS